MPEVELTGRAAPVYRLLDWPLRLTLVTLLWLLGVAAGLVIAGVAPATLAAHRLIVDYLDGPLDGSEVQPWSRFWSAWREWFGRGQLLLGLPLATVWVLAFYLAAARQTVWAVPLSVLMLGYLVSLWLLPAGAVSAGPRSVKEVWLLALHLSWRRPALPLAATFALVLLTVGVWYVAPAALVFGPGVAALAAVLVVRRVSSPRPTRGIPDPTKSGPPAR